MSAYALPGLFPPLPFYISDHVSVSISIDDSSSTQRLDYSSLEKEEKVEYEPSVLRTRSEATPQLSTPSCCCPCDSVDQIGVSVKDARLDILQWIQSLTSSAAPLLSANAAARKHRSSSVKSRNGTAPPLLHPDSMKLVSGSVAATAKVSSSLLSSSKERAMQLELSISWNGRQYSVVRSLERLRYLREELVAELPMLDGVKMGTTVPEMPHLPDNGSCANQSLAQLQGLLRSHIPAMEHWLNQVLRLVPHINDSATLTNFILEPVCLLLQNTLLPVPKTESEYSLPSLLRRSSLASISEDDEEE